MPTRSATMGADVEIVEPVFSAATDRDSHGAEALPCIKPTRVRVNGTDVGLMLAESLRVDPGNGLDRSATVTFTLLVHSITVCAENSA